jgi:hypothetical protein
MESVEATAAMAVRRLAKAAKGQAEAGAMRKKLAQLAQWRRVGRLYRQDACPWHHRLGDLNIVHLLASSPTFSSSIHRIVSTPPGGQRPSWAQRPAQWRSLPGWGGHAVLPSRRDRDSSASRSLSLCPRFQVVKVALCMCHVMSPSWLRGCLHG